jgi:hypothetical protein
VDSGEEGRRRKRERVGEGARKEIVPKAVRAVARKVTNEDDILRYKKMLLIALY